MVGDHAAVRAHRGVAQRGWADPAHGGAQPEGQELERYWSVQRRDRLGGVGDNDEPVRGPGHDLLPGVRAAAALDQPAVRGDLVGAVDGDVEPVDARDVFDPQAQLTRRVLSTRRRGGAEDVEGSFGQGREQKRHGRAGAKPDGHAALDQLRGRFRSDLLLSLNAHDLTPPGSGRCWPSPYGQLSSQHSALGEALATWRIRRRPTGPHRPARLAHEHHHQAFQALARRQHPGHRARRVTYAVLHDAAGLAPGTIGAICGCVITAALVVAMLFEGWPAALLRPATGRALTLALTAVVALVLYRVLAAYADGVRWIRAAPEDWIASASLSFARVGIMLHVDIGLRWPFAGYGETPWRSAYVLVQGNGLRTGLRSGSGMRQYQPHDRTHRCFRRIRLRRLDPGRRAGATARRARRRPAHAGEVGDGSRAHDHADEQGGP